MKNLVKNIVQAAGYNGAHTIKSAVVGKGFVAIPTKIQGRGKVQKSSGDNCQKILTYWLDQNVNLNTF